MEIVTFLLKTLEFPYGSMVGMCCFRHARFCKTGPNPSLNQPEFDRTGRVLKALIPASSRLGRVCTEKGPLIAGFSCFSSRISIIGPFGTFSGNRCQKGPDPGQKGAIRLNPGSNRARSSQIQSISGPYSLAGPIRRVPGSIQHLLQVPWS